MPGKRKEAPEDGQGRDGWRGGETGKHQPCLTLELSQVKGQGREDLAGNGRSETRERVQRNKDILGRPIAGGI